MLASARSLVTVEEIVDELEPRPGAIVLPTWAVGAVAEAPRGAHPSYAHDYYDRDNGFYQRWDEISPRPRRLPAPGWRRTCWPRRGSHEREAEAGSQPTR